jgi:hypothetical protein
VQKIGIARLLLGLCVYTSEEAVAADPARDPRLQLADTPTFKQAVQRVYIVCGVRNSLNLLAERANEVRRLADYVLGSTTLERTQFINDHASLIEQVRDQAALVQTEQKLLNENKDRLTSAEEVVNLRTSEIAQIEKDLKTAQAETDEEIRKLRDKSEQVLKLRQKVRDAITDNQKGERRIGELEKQARSLDDRDQ